MAFVTAKYKCLTPRLDTVYAILTVNWQSTARSITATDTRFVLAFNNGQTWTLYFSPEVTLTLSGFTTLTSSKPFTGTARVALIPDPTMQDVFDQAAGCILDGELWGHKMQVLTPLCGRQVAVVPVQGVVNDNLRNPWMSLLYANYATVHRTVALEKLGKTKMDDGLGRSWALYMAATRPHN